MSDELKPCPFCGGEAHVLKDGLPYVVIECERCFGRTNCNVTEAEAIDAWNMRTLGGGECEDVGQAAVFKCSECGWYSPVFTFGEGMPCFCPQCGKAVKR